MMFTLPKSVNIGGVDYEIRSDFRAVLELCTALDDPELTDNERGEVALTIFYPAFMPQEAETGEILAMPPEHYEEAIQEVYRFINCGEEESDRKTPKLIKWSQDFPLVVPPVNRIVGREVRELEYFHWWSFMSAYREIGDCFFAQVVGIRSKKQKGKALDKSEQEFYRQNHHLIELKVELTEQEKESLEYWGVT